MSRINYNIILLSLIVISNAGATEVSFIACPVYRDTDAGPKSGCWLATERKSGVTYDIGSGLTKPLSDRAVLVEGIFDEAVHSDKSLCGGAVLSPVRVSVLESQCQPHILPAENYPGRIFRPPGEVMQPSTVVRQLPQGPFADRTYSILFNFNSDFLNYQYSEVILEQASLYIRASKAKAVVIKGYAATEVLNVSGQLLQEKSELAKQRSEKVKLALTRLQVPAEIIHTDWQGVAEPVEHYAGGLEQETLRRVDVLIQIDGKSR